MSEKRLLQKVAANDMPSAATWRSGWDSNPRALADNLISSQARYDHFDTAPCINFVFVPRFLERHLGENRFSPLLR